MRFREGKTLANIKEPRNMLVPHAPPPAPKASAVGVLREVVEAAREVRVFCADLDGVRERERLMTALTQAEAALASLEAAEGKPNVLHPQYRFGFHAGMEFEARNQLIAPPAAASDTKLGPPVGYTTDRDGSIVLGSIYEDGDFAASDGEGNNG